MWSGWRKRALAYLALAFVAVGVLWALKTTPVEVRIVVDMADSRTLGKLGLREVRLSVTDSDGKWMGASVFTFPPDLHPQGPPAESPQVTFKLPQGTYEAGMQFLYGPDEVRREVVRKERFDVVEEGRVRLTGP